MGSCCCPLARLTEWRGGGVTPLWGYVGVWPLWYIPGSMVLHLFFVTSTPFSYQGIQCPQARFVHVHECSSCSFPNNGRCLMCMIGSIHMNVLHWYLASLTLCVPWPLSLLVGQHLVNIADLCLTIFVFLCP